MSTCAVTGSSRPSAILAAIACRPPPRPGACLSWTSTVPATVWPLAILTTSARKALYCQVRCNSCQVGSLLPGQVRCNSCHVGSLLPGKLQQLPGGLLAARYVATAAKWAPCCQVSCSSCQAGSLLPGRLQQLREQHLIKL